MSYAGIDIGATWTRIAIADNNGKIISKTRIETLKKNETKEEMLLRLESALRDIMRIADTKHLEAIGVGSIGPLDMKKGVILHTPNLPIENIPIGSYLSKKFDSHTYVVNDCIAAVVGEKYFGAGKDVENLVYITLSSGIGGGAIVDGNILFGKDGNAVEIGHIVVDYRGSLRCGCGGYGHWEAYTSGKNIGRFVSYLLETKYGYQSYAESVLSRYVDSPSKLEYPHIFCL